MREISLIININLGDDGIRQELDAEDDGILGELIDYVKAEFLSRTGKDFAEPLDCKLGELLFQFLLHISKVLVIVTNYLVITILVQFRWV